MKDDKKPRSFNRESGRLHWKHWNEGGTKFRLFEYLFRKAIEKFKKAKRN